MAQSFNRSWLVQKCKITTCALISPNEEASEVLGEPKVLVLNTSTRQFIDNSSNKRDQDENQQESKVCVMLLFLSYYDYDSPPHRLPTYTHMLHIQDEMESKSDDEHNVLVGYNAFALQSTTIATGGNPLCPSIPQQQQRQISFPCSPVVCSKKYCSGINKYQHRFIADTKLNWLDGIEKIITSDLLTQFEKIKNGDGSGDCNANIYQIIVVLKLKFPQFGLLSHLCKNVFSLLTNQDSEDEGVDDLQTSERVDIFGYLMKQEKDGFERC